MEEMQIHNPTRVPITWSKEHGEIPEGFKLTFNVKNAQGTNVYNKEFTLTQPIYDAVLSFMGKVDNN